MGLVPSDGIISFLIHGQGLPPAYHAVQLGILCPTGAKLGSSTSTSQAAPSTTRMSDRPHSCLVLHRPLMPNSPSLGPYPSLLLKTRRFLQQKASSIFYVY
jgi:hypothetical protein